MAVVTSYRLAEEIQKILNGGELQTASNISIPEIKIAIGQVVNNLLKTDYVKINGKTGETIPNGAVTGLYENIVVTKKGMISECSLPVKPLQLPRNMGVFSVWKSDEPQTEFIPVQMGQFGLLKSQPLLSNLLNQVGYETYGMKIVFTKDLTEPGKTITVDMRLMIMDISQYDDFDPLPILPEHEWMVKHEVIKLYAGEQTADRVVDVTTKELQGTPLNQQKQS